MSSAVVRLARRPSPSNAEPVSSQAPPNTPPPSTSGSRPNSLRAPAEPIRNSLVLISPTLQAANLNGPPSAKSFGGSGESPKAVPPSAAFRAPSRAQVLEPVDGDFSGGELRILGQGRRLGRRGGHGGGVEDVTHAAARVEAARRDHRRVPREDEAWGRRGMGAEWARTGPRADRPQKTGASPCAPAAPTACCHRTPPAVTAGEDTDRRIASCTSGRFSAIGQEFYSPTIP